MADPNTCDHVWELSDPNEETAFRKNSMMWSGERAHVRCSKCNARTWLSRDEWNALAIEEGNPDG